MRKAVVFALVVALAPAPVVAQSHLISLYADPGASTSHVADAPGLFYVYVVLGGAVEVTAARYRVSTCLTAWSWVVDENFFQGTTGDSQTGVIVDLGECLTNNSIVLQRISFLSDGTSPINSSIWVEPHPNSSEGFPEVLACLFPNPFTWSSVVAGAMCVNCAPNTSCSLDFTDLNWICPTCDGIPLPVETTTWGNVKALYR